MFEIQQDGCGEMWRRHVQKQRDGLPHDRDCAHWRQSFRFATVQIDHQGDGCGSDSWHGQEPDTAGFYQVPDRVRRGCDHMAILPAKPRSVIRNQLRAKGDHLKCER